MLVCCIERRPQQIAQASDHVDRTALLTAPHKPRYGMQCIEEEMWLELSLQGLQLGPCQFPLQLRCSNLFLPVARVVVLRVAQNDDEPVNLHPVIEG